MVGSAYLGAGLCGRQGSLQPLIGEDCPIGDLRERMRSRDWKIWKSCGYAESSPTLVLKGEMTAFLSQRFL